jgi:hypothetical protein
LQRSESTTHVSHADGLYLRRRFCVGAQGAAQGNEQFHVIFMRFVVRMIVIVSAYWHGQSSPFFSPDIDSFASSALLRDAE